MTGHRLRALVAVATVILSGHRASRSPVDDPEESLFRVVNALPDSIHVPVWIMMQAGTFGAAWLAAGAARLSGRRKLAFGLAGAGTASWLVCKLGKRVVGRDRPDSYLTDVKVRGRRQTGGGWPSGHAAVAMSLALLVTDGEDLNSRVLVPVALAVGLARVYVGAHLPYDVVGGYAIGVLSAAGVSALQV